MRYHFINRDKSAKCSVTLTWDGHWVGYEFLTVIRGRRINKRPNVRFIPQFVRLDSEEYANHMCEEYAHSEIECFGNVWDRETDIRDMD